MSHAKNKLRWCLNKAQKELEKGHKHRGIVRTEPSLTRAKEHMTKAEHNLKATLYLNKGGFTDWCSISLFYTIYHCFLSILLKEGFESRNQECTFSLIESLIDDKKINLNKEDIQKVALINAHETTAISLREKYQYNTKTTLENGEYADLLNTAKKILDKTKVIMEE
ncbi:HEPN domain-containing protein [Candidatus Woesearchaeota archaeon]|nr:HEPN domain-containing protein [Candidatus Woesearchaeota archaeon]